MTLQLCELAQPASVLPSGQLESQFHFLAWEVRTSVQFNCGEIVFPTGEDAAETYILCAGEILILRHGQPVDLIEAGEYFAPALWTGAIAIAYSDCMLAPVSPRPTTVATEELVGAARLELPARADQDLQPA